MGVICSAIQPRNRRKNNGVSFAAVLRQFFANVLNISATKNPVADCCDGVAAALIAGWVLEPVADEYLNGSFHGLVIRQSFGLSMESIHVINFVFQ